MSLFGKKKMTMEEFLKKGYRIEDFCTTDMLLSYFNMEKTLIHSGWFIFQKDKGGVTFDDRINTIGMSPLELYYHYKQISDELDRFKKLKEDLIKLGCAKGEGL